MANLLDIKSESAVFSQIDGIETIPVWARGQVGAMYTSGIFHSETTANMKASLTREQAAEYLYRMINLN